MDMFCAYRWLERNMGRDIANIIGAYCLPEEDHGGKRYAHIMELKYIQELRENYNTFRINYIESDRFIGIIGIYINLNRGPEWSIPHASNFFPIPRVYLNKYLIELLKSRPHKRLLSYKLIKNGRTKIIQLPSLIVE